MSSHIFIFSYAPNSILLFFAPSFLLLECLVKVLPDCSIAFFLPPLDFFFWYSHLSPPLHSQAAVLAKISHILLLPSLNLSLPLIAVLLQVPWSLSLLGWGWLPLSAWLCQKNSANHIALIVWMMLLKLVKLRWMLVYLVSWTDLKASWQFALKLTMLLPSALHHAKSELPASWLLQWWQLHPCPCCSRVLADWNSSSALSPNKAGPWIKLRPSNPWSCSSLALFEVSFQFVTVILWMEEILHQMVTNY